MEYYSEKGIDLSSNENTWQNFKCILLSEKSQYVKAIYYIISNVWHSEKCKTTATIKKKTVISTDGDREE